jgi:imidazolonepropionase-like amidohydrolase
MTEIWRIDVPEQKSIPSGPEKGSVPCVMLACVLGAVGVAWGAASQAPRVAPADLLIHSATIVDVRDGSLQRDRTIIIRGREIVEVTSGDPGRPWLAARTVDAGGRYVIPGLWDMHVHFGGGPELAAENQALLPLYVAHGVTAVRDAAGDLSGDVLAWRKAVAENTLTGPTIFTSGPKLEGYRPSWKGTLEVGTPAEVDAALDRLQAMRVDFVKITDNTLTPETYLYAVREASRRGLRVSAHVPMALTIEQVTSAGLTSIEHLDYLVKAGSAEEAQVAADFAAGRLNYAEASQKLSAGFDRERAMLAYRELATRGTFVTPTLNGSRIIAYLDRDNHSRDPFLAYIGPGLQATYAWRVERAAKDDAEAVERRHRRYEQLETVLPMLQAAGVSILAGTDAGYLNSYNYPGLGLHEELALFVRCGLTPLQALRSATLAGPRFFGLERRYGSIEPGREADMVLLAQDPLDDIRATRAIEGVVLHGRYFDRAALDDLLRTTAAGVTSPVAER